MTRTIIAYSDGGIDPASRTGGAGVYVELVASPGAKPVPVFSYACPIADGPTNQVAELRGAIDALTVLRSDWDLTGAQIDLVSDSAYVVNCFLQRWYLRWFRNGWKNNSGEAVSNRELWVQLMMLVSGVSKELRQTLGPVGCGRLPPGDIAILRASEKEGLPVRFVKCKGHSGLHGNEMADSLATRGKRGESVYQAH